MSILRLIRLAIHRLAGARLRGTARISLGMHARIGYRVLLDARAAPISVGDGAWVGSEATVLTGEPTATQPADSLLPDRDAVVIGPGAWLGPRCLLLPGVRIGAGAIVAADALVIGEVPPRVIVAGSPARPIGWRRAGDCLEFHPEAPPRTAFGDKTTSLATP